MVTPAYHPRDPSSTVLYQVIADNLETFLATLDADPMAKGLPGYVREEFYAYLQCGILAHGFVRLGCDTCPHKMLLAFSCKRRGFCPSCAGRRMAQLAAHLVEQVIPWVPTRQWVVSVPIPLRYWMASSKDPTATVHTIIRRAISQYYVNEAVKRGVDRKTAQAGSVTCVQRFGGSVNLHLHYHVLFLEGVYVDRTAQGLTPRFVTVEPPGDADIAAVVEKISHRVIRTLRQLGYLEADLDAAVATGYDPLGDDEPEWPAPPGLRCSSVLPSGSGQARRCAALVQGLATRVSVRPSPAPAVPACTGFPCMPMSRCRPIVGTNWNA
jgi:hypothetical protein